MNTKINIIKSSLMRNAQFFVSICLSFIMTPYIIHSIGNRMFGYWSLVGAFIGYYGLLDLGLSSAVERYTSQAIGRNDYNSMSKTASTSIVLFSIIGALSFMITVSIVLLSPLFLKNSDELKLFKYIMLILGTTISIGFPFKVYNGVIASFIRYDYISLVSISRSIISNLLIYYFLSKGSGILMMSVVSASMSVFEISIIYLICTSKFSNVVINFKGYDKTKIKQLFMYSKDTLVIRIADLLRFKIDSVVIALFLNVELVTYYVIGSKLVEYFGSIMISTIGIFIPYFSKYEGTGDIILLKKRFLEITRISTILSVFIGTSVIIYGKAFIQKWMGIEYDISYDICVILCVPAIIALTQTPGIQLLYGISKHNKYAIINIFEGISNVILSLILVRYYGIYGVALGTAIEMMIFKSIIQPIVICKSINLSYFTYFIETILYTGFKSILIIGAIYIAINQYIIPNYLNILLTATIHTIIFIPLAYMFLLNSDIRSLMLSSAKNI